VQAWPVRNMAAPIKHARGEVNSAVATLPLIGLSNVVAYAADARLRASACSAIKGESGGLYGTKELSCAAFGTRPVVVAGPPAKQHNI
jgi:hypothetical protein